MCEIIKLFSNLNKFFKFELLDYDKIDEIYQNSVENSKNITMCVDKIPVVAVARKEALILSNLLELCTVIRSVRESNSGYDNTYDCWDRVVEVSPREKYLMFVYTIVGLANYDPKIKIYRKLSMTTARAYFLSLTIPGSKGFHIFDEKIISRCLEVFQLIERIQNDGTLITGQDRIEMWVNFMNFFDDLKLMFRYVHFDEYKDVRNLFIWELVKVLYNNHEKGFENVYAANLHSKCFEIFEEIINAHNGDPEETLMKIMKMSFILHTHQPVPKISRNIPDSCTQFCSHISDWFSAIISKYPRILTKVLYCYIQCIVINPEKGWRTEQHQRALDYAAKYDSQLYIKCNESILSQISDMLRAEDMQIRQNAIELCNRIVLIESKVNWEVFRHEISNVPREVFAIKEIIMKLRDVNNVIKLKALHGLHQAYVKGNENSRKIITEGVTFATFNETEIFLPTEPRIRKKEVRYSRPKQLEPAYTYEGYEIIQPYFNELPNTIYGLWNCQNGFVRKAAIAMIEPIVILNPLVIYNTNFVKKCMPLSHDPNALVRKQALQMIDKILDNYPNCFPIIWAWCNVIAPLFEDLENKNNELSWECFKRRVFDNIKGIDQTNNVENFTPWTIIRVLLSTQNRQYLQACITEVAKKQLLDQKVLGFIESHTLTSNSTEAWTLLNFICEKMKCKEPDSLISIFIKSMVDQTWNAGQNLQIMLELLLKCIKDFSHSALNMAFSCIINLMKEGALPPTIIGKAFDFCMTIHMQSEHKRPNDISQSSSVINKRPHLKWVEDIHKICEDYLIQNLNNFYSNKTKFVSYMFSYSETNLELSIRPNQNVIKFIHNGIKEHINIPEIEYDSEDVNTLNQFIILSARFSIRDANIASESCLLYSLIMKKIDRPQIINTVLIALTDLCKRHTQIVELALGNVLHKLKSSYVENRMETFKNLATLILQDQLKLRGNVLLGLITIMLDENDELSNIAVDFFQTYILKKNAILFQTCLLECPFVYNEFMSFDGLETFSDIEIQSPLKGDDHLTSRHQLYNAFMLEVDEVNLLMYFDNLKLIYGKIQSDSSLKSAEGIAMIKDVIYILKTICEYISDKFLSKNTESNEDAVEDLNEASTSKTDKTNEIEKPKRNKRNIHSLKDAIFTVEKNIFLIPKISKILIQWSTSFEKLFDELNIAICKKFGNLVEYAQPSEFWQNYKHNYTRETSKRKNVEVDQNEKLDNLAQTQIPETKKQKNSNQLEKKSIK